MDITHITAEQKAHIDNLASKKARPIDMTPKENAYIYMGHGSDDTSRKITIPDGCVLVVKAHSGDVIGERDLVTNTINIIRKDNRDTVLNPNANKDKLYNILTDVGKYSSAIYNPGDECDDFSYYLFALHDIGIANAIGNSGILKINTTENIDESFNPWSISFPVDFDNVPLFTNINGVYTLNKLNGKDISKFYKYSNAYEYYYTEQHIKDILDAITFIANSSDSYILTGSSSKIENTAEISSLFNTKYKKLRKGYDGNNVYAFFIIDIKYDFSNRIPLSDYKMGHLFNFMRDYLIVKQSEIFNDVRRGLIKPGVFYNIVCRASNVNNTNRDRGREIINTIKMPKHVKNIIPEIKDRISEAERQRKGQIRDVGLVTEEGKASKNINETVNQLTEIISDINASGEETEESVKGILDTMIETTGLNDEVSYGDGPTDHYHTIEEIKGELNFNHRIKFLIFKIIQKRINEYEKVLESLKNPKRIPIWQRKPIVKPRVVKKKLIPWMRGGATEIEITKKIDELKKVLEIYFNGYIPSNVSKNQEKKRLTNMITRVKKFNTNTSSQTYKNYVENSSKSNAFTYKKGNNGKWKKYNKNGNPYVDPTPNTKAINTTNNAVNYKKGNNGKWKTIKRNVAPSVGGKTRRNRRN